jgi:hypothetical protein
MNIPPLGVVCLLDGMLVLAGCTALMFTGRSDSFLATCDGLSRDRGKSPLRFIMCAPFVVVFFIA